MPDIISEELNTNSSIMQHTNSLPYIQKKGVGHVCLEEFKVGLEDESLCFPRQEKNK